MRFRKIPVEIEAVQLTWANWNEICSFVPKPWFVRGVWLDKDGNPLPDDQWRFGENNDDLGLIMQTLESNQFLARGGDWIIKGVAGEFYPCKPDVFGKTYAAEPEPLTGAERIAEERRRQIGDEGFTARHDDQHMHGELAMAAQAYIDTARKAHAAKEGKGGAFWKLAPPAAWPWEREWWKPSDDPVRNLVKAGALIAAEIDRLQRKS